MNHFPRRLKRERLAAGHTQKTAAQQIGVSTATLQRWELGAHMPRPESAARIAPALGIPVARLFTDELVLAEVRVSAETLDRVKREGAPAAREAAKRIAQGLEALLLAEATRPPVDVSPGARPKRRRSRAEVLADQSARLAALKARPKQGKGRIE